MEMTRNNRLLYLLYQPYKVLVFLPLFILGTCFFVGLGVVLILFSGDTLANRIAGAWWARFSSFITPMRVSVSGLENIERSRSYIVVANHQSNYDIFVLFGWLGIDLKWVIKQELLKYPVFGYAVKKGGNIVIDRSDPAKAIESLEEARHRVKDGTSVVMLPEGTRSRTGRLGEFKKGAFVLALEMGLPILPVTISGTRGILPPGTLDLYPGRAVMKVHAPVETDGYGHESMQKLIDEVRGIVAGGLEECGTSLEDGAGG